MGDIRYVRRGELTATEALEAVDSGDRIVIELGVLGKTIRMVLRKGGGQYYCDTPIKLLTYEDRADMRSCLERYKLVQSDEETGPNPSDPRADPGPVYSD